LSLVFDPCVITGFPNPEFVVFTSQNSDGTDQVDHLDTDSDNDGCFDAIEVEGSITEAQLTITGEIVGPYDINGVPNLASGGQDTTSDVTTVGPDLDGDGISDACDDTDDRTDSDGDGIPDEVNSYALQNQSHQYFQRIRKLGNPVHSMLLQVKHMN